MGVEEDRLLLEEYAARQVLREKNETVISHIKAELFDRQIAFIDDPAREKGALCTRRAGKTQMWSRYAPIVCLRKSRSLVRIWAINRLRAKQLVWEDLKLVCARHKLCTPKDFNETELTVKFPNGSEIRLLGADKDKEAQKKRGDKTDLEVVLEAQLFGPYLRTLVEEVAGPCLFDTRGTFCLEGTPGPICVGYWFEVSGRDNLSSRWTSVGGKDGVGAGWSLHRWSVLNNPHLPHALEELTAIKKKRRWTDENPTYVREWLARWVNDLGILFYKYDPVRNSYEGITPIGPGWEHILGWDLGWRDDMALVVWGFHPAYRELFEVYSWKKPGAGAQEVMDQITELEAAGCNFIAKVADTGGGGRMYVEEVTARFGVFFEAAKKTDKPEHVRLFNDDLLGGFVRLKPGSVYAEEISALARDLEWPPPDSPEAPPREDPRCPNHCSDAGLYAWRRALHFLHRDEEPKAKPGSAEWQKKEEDRMLAVAEARMVQKLQEPAENPDYYEETSDY